MARDILGEFGPNSSSPQRARATSGGVTMAKELPYSPPQGPRAQFKSGSGHTEPRGGMAGESMGEGYEEFTGSPGIGGTNHGNSGSQGRR